MTLTRIAKYIAVSCKKNQYLVVLKVPLVQNFILMMVLTNFLVTYYYEIWSGLFGHTVSSH